MTAIQLGKPYITRGVSTSRLCCRPTIPDDAAQAWIDYSKEQSSSWRTHEDYPPACWQEEDFCLYVEIDNAYADGLCDDRADAFVVAMVYYAMVTGADIHSDAPVSRPLLHHLNDTVIPTLCREGSGFRRVAIVAPVTDVPVSTRHYVGTGMSCGIDSFHSLIRYTSDAIDEAYRLTHLTYLHMGSIFHPDTIRRRGDLKTFNETVADMYDEKLENARDVADAMGLPLIYIVSNLDRDIYRGGYGYTALYRNAALILATQGLWDVYYNSSSGISVDFYESTLRAGSAHYELMLIPAFCNGTVEFLIGGGDATRFIKTKEIADHPLVQKYLDVCFRFHNCGRCSKCYRTLIALDLLDKLDQFSQVFDVEYFKQHRHEAYGYLIFSEGRDETMRELIPLAKEQGKFTLRARLNALGLYLRIPLFRIIRHIPWLLNSPWVKKHRRGFM